MLNDVRKIPLLIIAYNRPYLLEKLFRELSFRDDLIVYVHLDGAREYDRQSVESRAKCEKIITKELSVGNVSKVKLQNSNLGGKHGVLHAIDWFFQHEEEGIIIEEDLEISLSLFEFFLDLRVKLKNMDIFALCFFNPIPNLDSSFEVEHWLPWGWATRREKWHLIRDDVERNVLALPTLRRNPRRRIAVRRFLNRIIKKVIAGEIQTWDAQVHAAILNKNLKCIFPQFALTKHRGLDENAEHADGKDWWTHIPLGVYIRGGEIDTTFKYESRFEKKWGMTRRRMLGDLRYILMQLIA